MPPEGKYFLGGDPSSDIYIEIKDGTIELCGSRETLVQLEYEWQVSQSEEELTPEDEKELREWAEEIVPIKAAKGELSVFAHTDGKYIAANNSEGGSGFGYDGEKTFDCEFGEFVLAQ